MSRPQTGDDTVRWYIRREGGPENIGPFNKEQLSHLWRQGLLARDDLLFAKGVFRGWVPVAELQNFLIDYAAERTAPSYIQVSEAAPTEGVPSELFLVDNGCRRGPIDLDQLQILLRWEVVKPATDVLDVDGERRTSVEELLRTGDWPQRKAAPQMRKATQEDGTARRADPERPKKQRRRQRNLKSPAKAPAHRGKSKQGPPARQLPKRTHSSSPRQDSFAEMLESAVYEEQQSEQPDDRQSLPRVSADGRPKANRQRKQSLVRLLRMPSYSRACMLWSGIYLAQALIFLVVSNAVFGLFLRRMGGLCLSTFIPFGATPEELKQEALLLAGFSTVLLGAAMAYPIWHLRWTDCLPWHGVACTLLGMLLGMAMKAEVVPQLFVLARLALMLGGLGLGAVCVWLMLCVGDVQMATKLLVPLALTILCIGGIAACDMRQFLVIDIGGLPPSVEGRLPHAAVFLLSVYVMTLAYPAFCYFALSTEASPSVKQFMDSHLMMAIGCGIAVIVFSYCLFRPRPDQFMSIPLALIPLAAVNGVVSTVPPVMWMISPANVGIR